ncbi:MAG: hypothetical protein PHD15_00115 [Clostridia bacterium]|nr:hypothetical protein [Clostridia bacterium]MDD4386156.1 hypothetical protein [Clostridia bacterium]
MQVIIDGRVNEEVEKYFLELGYEIIKVKKHNQIYNEISSHTDIFCVKINDTIIYEEGSLSGKINDKYNVFYGDNVDNIYPNCAIYNVCTIDNYAVHNFEITDKTIINILIEKGYNLINVKQGYSNCSILPLSNKCCITSDKGIYDILINYNFDVLYIDQSELDIKLFSDSGIYSEMCGFIGGCSSVIDDTVIFFGDIDRFKCKEILMNYIYSKGFKIKDFKNMDVIDYGSCIFID